MKPFDCRLISEILCVCLFSFHSNSRDFWVTKKVFYWISRQSWRRWCIIRTPTVSKTRILPISFSFYLWCSHHISSLNSLILQQKMTSGCKIFWNNDIQRQNILFTFLLAHWNNKPCHFILNECEAYATPIKMFLYLKASGWRKAVLKILLQLLLSLLSSDMALKLIKMQWHNMLQTEKIWKQNLISVCIEGA